jgi:putative Holliday junction resolvase
MTSLTSEIISGKRILALDYGERRTGVAVCDEMHIVVSSRPIIETDEHLVRNVLKQAENDRIDLIVVGVPVHHDDRITPIIQAITEFVAALASSTSIPVYPVDEAFSTRDARAIMVASGMKKKKRQTKGVKDQVAAAVILQRVLNELSVRPL